MPSHFFKTNIFDYKIEYKFDLKRYLASFISVLFDYKIEYKFDLKENIKSDISEMKKWEEWI